MFSPFATRACIDLVVVDDEIAERRERFEFSLKRTTDLDRRINVDPSPGEIYNDGINFTSSSPASVNDAVIAASVLSVVVAIAIVAVTIVIIFHRRKAKKIVLLE